MAWVYFAKKLFYFRNYEINDKKTFSLMSYACIVVNRTVLDCHVALCAIGFHRGSTSIRSVHPRHVVTSISSSVTTETDTIWTFIFRRVV